MGRGRGKKRRWNEKKKVKKKMNWQEKDRNMEDGV